MFARRKRALAKKQVSPSSAWFQPQGGFATVVFVHGILGSQEGTWGKFPALLCSDPDLPKLGILSWGYRSGLVPASYRDVETEGNALISDLEILLKNDCRIYIIGHSMGGLVILKGLVERITAQAADSHPVSNVCHITLYASPLQGSAFANAVRLLIGVSFWSRLVARFLPSEQLRDLQRGSKLVEDLLGTTNDLIYRPPENSKLVRRNIPVRVCVAKHDAIVSKNSAIGLFKSSPYLPIFLDADHHSVKNPDNHTDQRYLAFKIDLDKALIEPFNELCKKVLTGASEHERRVAAAQFDDQYGDMAKRCAKECMGRPGLTHVSDDDLYKVVPRIWEFGAQGNTTPSAAVAHVVVDFRYGNDLRLKR